MYFLGSFPEVLLISCVIFKDVQTEKTKASLSLLRTLGRVNLHLSVCSWRMQLQDEIFSISVESKCFPSLTCMPRQGWVLPQRLFN